MKKLLLGIIAVVSVSILYYFTVGSKQIVREIKKEVNQEILALNGSGFNIKKDNIDITKEHFEIDFNDTKKIENYFRQNGMKNIDKELLELLRGAVFGVDIVYNPSPTKAVALDIYPIKLPTALDAIAKSGENEILAKISNMLKNREILAHLEVNKLASSFEGYLKDIDIENSFKLTGFEFDGELDNFNINSINQKIDYLWINILGSSLVFNNYRVDIKNPFDELNGETIFTIEAFSILDSESEILVKRSSGFTKIKQGNNLLINNMFDVSLAEVNIKDRYNSDLKLKDVKFNMEIKNLSSKVLEILNEEMAKGEIDDISNILNITRILAKDSFRVDIPKISISKIDLNKRELGSLDLTAYLYLDKNKVELFQVDSLEDMLKFFIVNVNVEASNEFISFLSENQSIMVFMMILTPIDNKNGKKVYTLDFIDGNLKINGNNIF